MNQSFTIKLKNGRFYLNVLYNYFEVLLILNEYFILNPSNCNSDTIKCGVYFLAEEILNEEYLKLRSGAYMSHCRPNILLSGKILSKTSIFTCWYIIFEEKIVFGYLFFFFQLSFWSHIYCMLSVVILSYIYQICWK